jgi:hypothetical protein
VSTAKYLSAMILIESTFSSSPPSWRDVTNLRDCRTS